MSALDWVRETEELRRLLSAERQKSALLEIELSKLKSENTYLKREKLRAVSAHEIPDSCVVGGV